MIVRGTVRPKFAVDCKNNVLVSQETGDKAVIIERTQTYVYSGWKSFFQFTSGHRALYCGSLPRQEASTLRMVPFVLVENDQQPLSDFIVVIMGGSVQPLPLTTVHNHLQPVNPSPYGFLQVLFFPKYPVGLLDEEKILPPGKDVTAVGICDFNNGVPEIKSWKDLPYFLGWNRWKSWMDGGDTDNIPDGQLCVVCLTRRRMQVFIPCGHVVCCGQCALAIEQGITPRCPVCCQTGHQGIHTYILSLRNNVLWPAHMLRLMGT